MQLNHILISSTSLSLYPHYSEFNTKCLIKKVIASHKPRPSIQVAKCVVTDNKAKLVESRIKVMDVVDWGAGVES